MTEHNVASPAFPITTGNDVFALGLTKREWFAGQAIRARWGDGTSMTAEDAARLAFQLADAMIAEGSKGDD